jgi:type II secretory pathway component PulC
MRLLSSVLAIGLAACGPKVQTTPVHEEDLVEKPQPATAETAAAAPERPVAPPGKGLRTGTIERAKLIAVLDQGPPVVLRQLDFFARMDGNRFVGWQLTKVLDTQGMFMDVDLAPGDVLLAINGKPISRPDQFQTVWDSLRTANQLNAELWRGNSKLELSFQITPAVAGN